MNQSHKFALGTFSIAGCAPFSGVLLGEQVIAINALAQFFAARNLSISAAASTLELLQNWEVNFKALSAGIAAFRAGEMGGLSAVDVSALKVHAPLMPRQIFCCGANYREHVIDYMVDLNVPEVKEFGSREEKRAHAEKLVDHRSQHGRPYVFTKPPSCIAGPYDPIVLPANATQPDWEAELAVVIGRKARHVSKANALDYVAGYTVANDTSLRELLFREDFKAMGTDWLACKSSPAWSPLGPYLVPSAFVGNPHDLRLTLKLNGETKQDARTNDMIFDIARQIEYISSVCELQPGDLIGTGSPAGNGLHYGRFMQPGDVIECSVEGVGTQRNRCVAELS